MSVLYYSVDKMWNVDFYFSFGCDAPSFRLIGTESYWIVPGTMED